MLINKNKKNTFIVFVVIMASILALAGCSNSAGGAPNYRELSTAQVGDIIFKNGKVLSATEITAALKNDAVAVVYKVANGKAWAVGKKHQRSGLAWAKSSTTGYSKKIENLVTNYSGSPRNLTFSGVYLDGSTGWTKLQNTSGVNDTGTAGNYPAWEWVNAYGTTNGLTGTMQNDWYFPSIAELFDIWKNTSTVEASLDAIGGDKFTNGGSYWSSSQYASDSNYALGFHFGAGGCSNYNKRLEYYYVCAVRAFTY